MNRIFAKLVVMMAFLFPLTVFATGAETYAFDPSHTYVLWHVNHFGFSIQAGKFTMVDGTLTLDEAKPENSKVNVTINTNDIATGIPKLDDHLRSKEFFDAEKFPTATFVSNKVSVKGKDIGKVYGILTMHGISKPVVLDVKLNKMGMHPMNHKKTLGFSATTTIKRSEFGINYGLPAVSDDVKIAIGAEANLAS